MSIHITSGLNTSRMGLPKWPQMVVRGTPVTVDQAKEIIRRTDSSFTLHMSGNDHKTVRLIATKLGLPSFMYYDPKASKEAEMDWGAAVEFRKLWGTISTEYVHNNWVSSAFVFGPHGWCHPDGTIRYDDNVGKWPGVDDIINDWDTLATEFPFLDLTATLMSGESCEDDTHAVVTLKVKNGTVTVCPPEPIVNSDSPPRDLGAAVDAMFVRAPGRECGIPMEWIDEWAAQHWAKVQALQVSGGAGG